MNWRRISLLAASLFMAQALIGFMEGVLFPAATGVLWLLAGHIASFAACVAIFSYFAAGISSRPFIDAWLGLLLQVVAGLLISAALTPWLSSPLWGAFVAEWAALVAALVVGTSIGIGIRRRARRPADA